MSFQPPRLSCSWRKKCLTPSSEEPAASSTSRAQCSHAKRKAMSSLNTSSRNPDSKQSRKKPYLFSRTVFQGIFSESLKEQLSNMFSQFHLFPEILPTVLPIQSEMKDSSNLGGLIFDLSRDPLPTTSRAWGVPDTPSYRLLGPAEKLPASRVTNQPNPVGRSL